MGMKRSPILKISQNLRFRFSSSSSDSVTVLWEMRAHSKLSKIEIIFPINLDTGTLDSSKKSESALPSHPQTENYFAISM